MSPSQSTELNDWLAKLELLDPSHIELGLDRTKAVLARLNLPAEAKIIMVAGTNGKGSTVAVLDKLLSTQGKTVGAYTSPHILHFHERIRIRGKFASSAELVLAFEAIEAVREDTPLTYFEFATLAAAYLFSNSDLDFWLMEVGLGGRLDAVNVFDADVSIVTNIGLDHQQWLGNTLEEIGAEKAAIYRTDKPAIFGAIDRPLTIDQSVISLASNGRFAGRDFGLNDRGEWWHGNLDTGLILPVDCNIAPENLSAAIAALAEIGHVPSQSQVDELEFFTLPGRHHRFNYVGTQILADVAHNEDSARCLAQKLDELPNADWIAVIGAMGDKSLEALIEPMLDKVSEWVLVRPCIDRAASIQSLEHALTSAGVSKNRIQACPDIQLLPSIFRGREAAVIYGSFYTIGECFSVMGVEIV